MDPLRTELIRPLIDKALALDKTLEEMRRSSQLDGADAEVEALKSERLEPNVSYGERLAIIETKLNSLATKEDLAKLDSKIAWKATGALLAGFVALLVVIIRMFL